MIKLIDTLTNYKDCLENLANYKQIAIDIETYIRPEHKGKVTKAVDPFASSIALLAIKPKGGEETYVLDILILEQLNYNKSLLKDYLASREYLLCHQASFEAKFLKKYFGVLFDNWWCTKVASQLVSNATGNKYTKAVSGNGLADLCLDYLDVKLKGKGTTQIEDWHVRPLTEERIAYSAMDVEYLEPLKEVLTRTICYPLPEPDIYDEGETWGLGMQEILELEMQFIQVVAECEYNGLPINGDLCKTFQQAIKDEGSRTGELYKVGGELCELTNLTYEYPPGFKAPYKIPTLASEKALNSSTKLKQLINKYIGPADTAEAKVVNRILSLLESKGNPSGMQFYCDEEANKFKELEDLSSSEVLARFEIADLLVSYRRYAKQASMQLSKYIHPLTGRIHYTLNSLGASTGRCSSSNINSQNITSRTPVNIMIDISSKDSFLIANCTHASSL